MAERTKKKLRDGHVVKLRDNSEGSHFYMSLLDDALNDCYPGKFLVNWDYESMATTPNGETFCDVIVFRFSDPDAAFAFKMRWA